MHKLLAPWNCWPPKEQPGCAMIVQAPLMVLQHAPGWAHALGWHEPAALNTLPLRHCAAVVAEQLPLRFSQQEPMQGEGAQVMPSPM